MKRVILLSLVVSIAGLAGCYNPELNDFPFVCGGSHGRPECPDGYNCYGGQCLKSPPGCWDQYFGNIQGNRDKDFEPNNIPDLAVTLICGDEVNPNCPPGARYNTPNQYGMLVICGEAFMDPQTGAPYGGDRDYFKIYLMAGEGIDITLKHNYQAGRDLDLRLLADRSRNYLQLKQSASTNDDEQITHTADYTGWHFIEVKGKTPMDNNGYALQWSLIAPQ